MMRFAPALVATALAIGACGGSATNNGAARDDDAATSPAGGDATTTADASSSSATDDAAPIADASVDTTPDAKKPKCEPPPVTDPCDCRAGLSACGLSDVDACAPLASCDAPFRYDPGACFKDFRLSGTDNCTASNDATALCCASFFN